jgi:hypothetical protein
MSQSDATNQPPGFRTRKTSAAIACLSGMWTIESFEKTMSKVPGGKGRGPGATLQSPIRSESPAASTSSRPRAITPSSTSMPVT